MARESHKCCVHLLQQHDLGLIDHSSKERFRFLRPLLKIILLAKIFLRSDEALHIDET